MGLLRVRVLPGAPHNFNHMATLLETLKTVGSEHQYIKDAYAKQSKLPKHYWRIALCRFFFLKDEDETDKLPIALRKNFCPLFWFSNFLLLIAPIWVTIYLLITFLGWLGEKLGNGFENIVIDNYKAKKKVWRANRDAEIEKEGKVELEKRCTYDPKTAVFGRLKRGRDEIKYIIHQLIRDGEIEEVEWESKDFQTKLGDHYEDARYFASFRAFHGPKWKEALTAIEIQREEQCAKDARDRAIAEAARLEKERKKNAFYAKVFGYAKTFFQALALIVAIPVILFLVYWLYIFVVWAGGYIGQFFYFIFVTRIWDTLRITGWSIVVIAALVFICAFFAADVFRVWFWRPLGKKILWFGENILEPGAERTGKGLKWLFSPITKGVLFVWDFGKMFFSNNCPVIEWEEEKKAESK